MYRFYYLVIGTLLCCISLKAQNNQLPLFNLYDLELSEVLNRATNNQQIGLPFPNGETILFQAQQNNVLSDDLKNRYNDLLTFDIYTSTLRGKLTIGNGKLYASIRTPRGLLAIVPSSQEIDKYKSYYGTIDPEQTDIPIESYACEQDASLDWNPLTDEKDQEEEKSGNGFNRGGVLTTYRLAIVTTGEFEDANGANSMARITSTVQAWNLIYEVDLGITLSLVNTQIYGDPATDPFTPDGAGGDHRVNQAAEVVAMNFAENTYDVGQVFHNSSVGGSWSGGGVAGIGVACSSSTFFSTSSSYESTNDGLTGPNKAAAWSGSFNNTGNGWIQLSAHELGHQFNASHTFNGSGSNCVGGNVPQNDSYEIGSGTTIMSYNGLCSAGQNIPDGGEDDNYFHTSSIERMINYITTGTGSNCGTDNNIVNTAPTIDANPNNQTYTIPINTPFELTGTASDIEGDNLTYCWEQYDEDGSGTPTQGKIGSAAAADPLAPLFRSFPPSDSPNRSFPNLTDILDGNNTGLSFEALPSVDRSIIFAFTVRDNNPLGGSVVCDNIEIEVEDTGGAFEITSQNVPTTLFNNGSGGTFDITWSVAGTTGGNIQCTQIDILFSVDGGITFPTVLANNTANDGSETLNIPSQLTTIGRIKIIASNNIFFDINNGDITITDMCEADGVTFSPDAPITADEGGSSLDLDLMPVYDLPINDFTGTLSTDDPASNLAFDNLNGNCSGPSNSNNYDVFEFITDASGNYTFTRSSPFGQLLNLYSGTFNPNSVCSNWLGSTATRPSGMGSVNLGNSVTVNLNANTTYSLVVSTFSTNASYYGSYTVTFSGAGQILEEVQPDPGFEYTYVIVEGATNDIATFEDDPDLSAYTDGSYTIYGLEKIASLSTAALNNDYAGSGFSNLQNDINSDIICADLSSNTKVIIINDTGSNFPDNAIPDATYDGVTDTVRACQTIMATSDIINGSDITFIAGQSITLMAGFSTENSTFLAMVEICPSANNQMVEERQQTFIGPTKLNIYPNPVADELFLEFNDMSTINNIKIYDQLGRIVKYFRNNIRSISLSDLANGMYIIVVETEENTFKKKIIKQ